MTWVIHLMMSYSTAALIYEYIVSHLHSLNVIRDTSQDVPGPLSDVEWFNAHLNSM